MKLFVLVIGVSITICIARYVYGVTRYVYGIARYENDIQCKVLEIYNIPIANKNAESIYKGYTLKYNSVHCLVLFLT